MESELGVGTSVTVTLTLPHARSQPESCEEQVSAAVLGEGEAAARFAVRLRDAGVGKVSEVSLAELPYLTDCCIFVDLDADAASLQQLREHTTSGFSSMLPLIGFADADASALAMDLQLLSFVTAQGSESSLHRAIELATRVLRRAGDSVESATARNGYSVLIAEDNATNQMIARIALERAGYACTIVDDGEKALHELSTKHFDAALIDMHMPLMDGLEVAKLYNFAAFEDEHKTPIIMVTADNRPDVVADADLAGISRFVVKPIKPSLLLRTLEELLEQCGPPVPSATGVDSGSAAGAESAEPELDPFIFEELLSYMDKDEARQFFAEFAEDAEGYIASLRRFAAGEVGFEKVRDQMHALSGAGRTVGAATLAAHARLIEYGREADLGDRATQVAAELDEALDRALGAIARRLDKLA